MECTFSTSSYGKIFSKILLLALTLATFTLPTLADAAFCKYLLQNEKFLSFVESTPARRKGMFIRRIQEYADLSPQDKRLQDLAAAAKSKELISLASFRGEKEILAFLDDMPDLSREDSRGLGARAALWGFTVGTYTILYALFADMDLFDDPLYWYGVAMSVPVNLLIDRLSDRTGAANRRENKIIENIKNIVKNDAFELNDFLFYTRKIDNARWGAMSLAKEGPGVYVLDVVAW